MQLTLWCAGFDVAERMGIIPALGKADLNISNIAFVDNDKNEKVV